MRLSLEEKEKIQTRLVEQIIAGLKNHDLRIHDLHPLSTTILERLDHLHTKEEFDNFIQHLSKRWHIFQSLVTGGH